MTRVLNGKLQREINKSLFRDVVFANLKHDRFLVVTEELNVVSRWRETMILLAIGTLVDEKADSILVVAVTIVHACMSHVDGSSIRVQNVVHLAEVDDLSAKVALWQEDILAGCL